jgi:hypothetical protein
VFTLLRLSLLAKAFFNRRKYFSVLENALA